MPRQPRKTADKPEDQPSQDLTPPTPEWTKHYPDRWRQELAALDATGWTHHVAQEHDQAVLRVDYPLPQGLAGAVLAADGANRQECRLPELLSLEVWFPDQYPFFPPTVIDRDKKLQLRRHRNAHGFLCLVEADDWRVDTTVADLLTLQLPRLLHAGTSNISPGPDVEVQRPEPASMMLPGRTVAEALIMPHQKPPHDADEGALVVRYSLGTRDLLGTGLVERILGDGVDTPGPAARLHPAFRIVSYGRWARDPDFDASDSAEATHRRLEQRLRPIHVDDTSLTAPPESDPGTRHAARSMPSEVLETLCLLVPSERGYRRIGEEWVALQRLLIDGEPYCRYLPVQYLGGERAEARTPESGPLARRHVVIVGLGAVGAHVAVDLVRTGVGRVDLVDGDQTDVATASRQYAPVFGAGRPKVETLASHLIVAHPDTDLRVFDLFLGQPSFSGHDRKRLRELEQRLRTADLVVDATAATAVTRYVAAIRQAHGADFLHVSATAGAWGGCVHLATAASGCWACLQHHRHDGAVPVPLADPAGTITPPGCSDPSFTGTNPDLATIAHHASRVAIDRLLGAPGLGGDLYVARLRRPDGIPRPASWRAVPVPVHPDCPLHRRGADNAPASDGCGGIQAHDLGDPQP